MIPLPTNRCSGVSGAATELLSVLSERANREGRVWIDRGGIAAATGTPEGRAPSILQEVIDHGDVILETCSEDGWVLVVLRECGPG